MLAITTELHRRSGPLTTVPLPGNASSLVWVETPAEAARLVSLARRRLRQRARQARLKGLLGAISDVGPRATYPLPALPPREWAPIASPSSVNRRT